MVDLFTLQITVQLTHWQTTGYAEHKALGKMYDSLTDLTDTFIETYFGKYGRVPVASLTKLEAGESVSLCNELYRIAEGFESELKPVDTDLLNIAADMKALANHTKYLLTLK